MNKWSWSLPGNLSNIIGNFLPGTKKRDNFPLSGSALTASSLTNSAIQIGMILNVYLT